MQSHLLTRQIVNNDVDKDFPFARPFLHSKEVMNESLMFVIVINW